MAETTSGRMVRIMRTKSPRISSRPHRSKVSSTLNEYPKSTARVKYCSAPSRRCAACSSSVRRTASASNSSGPISFWPPSPRVAESSTVRWPSPFDRRASSALFSSSGWATIDRKTPVLFRARRATPSCARPSPESSGWAWAAVARTPTATSNDTANAVNRLACIVPPVFSSPAECPCGYRLSTGTPAAWSGRRETIPTCGW